MNPSQQSSSFVIPVLGPRRAPIAADTMMHYHQLSVTQTGIGQTQHLQDSAVDVEPSANQDCQTQATEADVCSAGRDPTAASHSSGWRGTSQRVPSPSSSVGSDGDSEYDGGDEDEESDSDRGEAIDESDVDDGTEQPGAEMPLSEADTNMDFLSAEEHPDVMWYRELDDTEMEMVLDAEYCPAEVMEAMPETRDRLLSDLKRARWEISEDEDIEECQHQRSKRIKRGGDAAGSNSKGLPYLYGQHSQKDQQPIHFRPSYKRDRKQAEFGSHVRRLHEDRLKHRIETRMYNYGYYPQPDIVVYANYDNSIGELQSQPASHRQRLAGSGRTNPALNATVEDTAGGHVSHAAPEGDGSNASGNQPNPGDVTRVDAHTAPRRQHRQPARNTIRDDPFFSDELFNGMLTGQPDRNHVGRIYTRSQQRDIDEYYQRVTGARPEVGPERDTPGNGSLGSGQQQMTHNIPGAPSHGGFVPPYGLLPGRLTRPAPASVRELDYGDIRDWDDAWASFVYDHDGKALLRGHYPDEYK